MFIYTFDILIHFFINNEYIINKLRLCFWSGIFECLDEDLSIRPSLTKVVLLLSICLAVWVHAVSGVLLVSYQVHTKGWFIIRVIKNWKCESKSIFEPQQRRQTSCSERVVLYYLFPWEMWGITFKAATLLISTQWCLGYRWWFLTLLCGSCSAAVLIAHTRNQDHPGTKQKHTKIELFFFLKGNFRSTPRLVLITVPTASSGDRVHIYFPFFMFFYRER